MSTIHDNNQLASTEPITEYHHSLDLETPTKAPPPKKRCCSKLHNWYEYQQTLDEIDQHIFVVLFDFSRSQSWKKKTFSFTVFLLSIGVAADSFYFGYISPKLVEFLKWTVQHSIVAMVTFITFYAVATLMFIPPFLLTFAAGYIYRQVYGPVVGFAVAVGTCFTGSYIGAILAFLRARYMTRDLVKLFSRRFSLIRAADKALIRNGLKVMLLLRLCPIVPFSATNYIGGVTGVRWEIFSIAILGIIPMQVLTVAAGASAGSISYQEANNSENSRAQEILMLVGLIFGFIAVILTWIYAKIELKKEILLAKQNEAFIAKGAQYHAYQERLSLYKMGPDHIYKPDSEKTLKVKKECMEKLHSLSQKEIERMKNNGQPHVTQSMLANLSPMNKGQGGGGVDKARLTQSAPANLRPINSFASSKNDESLDVVSLDATSVHDDETAKLDKNNEPLSDFDEEWWWIWV